MEASHQDATVLLIFVLVFLYFRTHRSTPPVQPTPPYTPPVVQPPITPPTPNWPPISEPPPITNPFLLGNIRNFLNDGRGQYFPVLYYFYHSVINSFYWGQDTFKESVEEAVIGTRAAYGQHSANFWEQQFEQNLQNYRENNPKL